MKREHLILAVLAVVILAVGGCAPTFQETGRIKLNQGWQAIGTDQTRTNPFGKEYSQPGMILDPPGPAYTVITEPEKQQVVQQPAAPPQMPAELGKAKLRTPAPPAQPQVRVVNLPPQQTVIQTPQEPKFYYGAPGGSGIGFAVVEGVGNAAAGFLSGGLGGKWRRPDNYNNTTSVTGTSSTGPTTSTSGASTGPINNQQQQTTTATATAKQTQNQDQQQKQAQKQDQQQKQKMQQDQTLKGGGKKSHGHGGDCD